MQTLFSDNKHERQLKAWLRSIDLKPSDLTYHPQFDDLRLLTDIKRDVWGWLSKRDREYWHYYWTIVYTDRKPLNDRAIKQLKKIMDSVIYRQQKAAEARQRIRQMKKI